MRFWLLKTVARCLGLSVQMIAYQHVTPPHVAARAMSLAAWREYLIAREGLYGRREVKCVVFATDSLAAVEMFHSVNLSMEMDQQTAHADVH